MKYVKFSGEENPKGKHDKEGKKERIDTVLGSGNVGRLSFIGGIGSTRVPIFLLLSVQPMSFVLMGLSHHGTMACVSKLGQTRLTPFRSFNSNRQRFFPLLYRMLFVTGHLIPKLNPAEKAGCLMTNDAPFCHEKGISTVKVVPVPILLSKLMLPPRFSIILWQMESPSPVPLPGGFVVKNRLKILA